jgi:hypothetical protein
LFYEVIHAFYLKLRPFFLFSLFVFSVPKPSFNVLLSPTIELLISQPFISWNLKANGPSN